MTTTTRQQQAVASWNSSIASGIPRSSLVHVEEELCEAFPELGELYERWLALFSEDSARHQAENAHRNPMLLDSGPAFTPDQWRLGTRNARYVYETALKQVTQGGHRVADPRQPTGTKDKT
jgi:hypothetical protein